VHEIQKGRRLDGAPDKSVKKVTEKGKRKRLRPKSKPKTEKRGEFFASRGSTKGIIIH
jgi:hypothetical protein